MEAEAVIAKVGVLVIACVQGRGQPGLVDVEANVHDVAEAPGPLRGAGPADEHLLEERDERDVRRHDQLAALGACEQQRALHDLFEAEAKQRYGARAEAGAQMKRRTKTLLHILAALRAVNGKLDARALPTPEYHDGDRYRAPSTLIE